MEQLWLLAWPVLLLTKSDFNPRIGAALLIYAAAIFLPVVLGLLGFSSLSKKSNMPITNNPTFWVLVIAILSVFVTASGLLFGVTDLMMWFYVAMGPLLLGIGTVMALRQPNEDKGTHKTILVSGVVLTYMISAPWLVGFFTH